MTRPRTFTIAAVLMLLFSIVGIALELPNMLALPPETQYNGDGPPLVLSLVNVIIGGMGLVAAFGVWRMQKWAVALTIVLSAINILTTLPAILFAPTLDLQLIGVLGVVWAAAIIALLLWPRPNSRPAVSQTN